MHIPYHTLGALRPLHKALAIGVALVSACSAYAANSGGLSDHNSNAPVNYAADRIELQDKQNRVLLTGESDRPLPPTASEAEMPSDSARDEELPPLPPLPPVPPMD